VKKMNGILDKWVEIPIKKLEKFNRLQTYKKMEELNIEISEEILMKKKTKSNGQHEFIELPKTTRPRIVIGEVIEKLKKIPEKSIDVIITSPPYWQQRDYGEKGQIGQETTSEKYIQKMVEVGEHLKRVLKDSGSYFLNMGDKYVEKNLQMIPFRTATEMQRKGWMLRNVIIWYKPDHMPSSIKDRFSNTWEPVFFFVKGTGKYYAPEYYVNIDPIRVPHTSNGNSRSDLPLTLSEDEYQKRKDIIEAQLTLINGKYQGKFKGHERNRGASPGARLSLFGEYYTKQRAHKINSESETKIIQYLRRWRGKRNITSKEIDKLLNKKDTAGHWFRLDHGRSLPRPEDWLKLKKILGFDDGYDKIMTETRYVLQTVKPHLKGKNPGDMWNISLERLPDAHFSIFPTELPKRIISAFCPPNGMVLDPFAGSGTTGKAAMQLGRRSILIDIKPEYAKLIERRCGLRKEKTLPKFLDENETGD